MKQSKTVTSEREHSVSDSHSAGKSVFISEAEVVHRAEDYRLLSCSTFYLCDC